MQPARLVQRHAHDAGAEDLRQLAAGFDQRAAEAGQAPVALEETLERDLCHGVGFGRRHQALLQRHRGVQAARPDAPGGDAAGDFVEQFDARRRAARNVRRGGRRAAPTAPGAPLRGGSVGAATGRRAARPARPARSSPALREHGARWPGSSMKSRPSFEVPRDRQRLPEKGAARGLRRAARQHQRHLGLVEQDAVGLVEQRHAQAAQQRRRCCAGASQRRGGALERGRAAPASRSRRKSKASSRAVA